jgi:hypothetical protein
MKKPTPSQFSVYQQVFDFFNRERAEKMEKVGLMPSANGLGIKVCHPLMQQYGYGTDISKEKEVIDTLKNNAVESSEKNKNMF